MVILSVGDKSFPIVVKDNYNPTNQLDVEELKEQFLFKVDAMFDMQAHYTKEDWENTIRRLGPRCTLYDEFPEIQSKFNEYQDLYLFLLAVGFIQESD